MEIKKTYLGDGVYAEFDGWSIWLYTEREDGVHRIAIEPAVFMELYQYAKSHGFKVKESD